MLFSYLFVSRSLVIICDIKILFYISYIFSVFPLYLLSTIYCFKFVLFFFCLYIAAEQFTLAEMLGFSYNNNNNTSSSSINSLNNSINNSTSHNSSRGSSTLMSSSQTGSLSPGPFTPMTPSSTQSSMSPGILIPPTKNFDGFQVCLLIFLKFIYYLH